MNADSRNREKPSLPGVSAGSSTGRPSARDVAYEWLLAAITSLPWDQESFLNEMEIAEASGTSRTPVREALQRLAAAGLVRHVPNKGVYVPALSDGDIERMMEARLVIENWAIDKVIRTGADMSALHDHIDRQRQLVDEPLAFIGEDVRFHRHIVDTADNPALSRMYQSLRELQLRLGVSAVHDVDDRTDLVVDEHRAIVDAIAARDAEAARAALTAHLDQTTRALHHRPGTDTLLSSASAN